MSTAANTIILRGDNWLKEEALYGVAGTPGMLLEEYNAAGTTKVRPHTVRGGTHRKLFAIENGLRGPMIGDTGGNTINDAYGVGERGFYVTLRGGDKVNALLKVGENVAKDDYVISGGDGTVVKAAASYLANNAAASTTVTNTTTETTFSNGTVTVPANALSVGDTIRIRGSVSFPGSVNTDTATVKVKIGSTAILTSAAVDITNADVCIFDATLVVRTIGTSGTLVGFGWIGLGIIGTATGRAQQLASTTVNTTAAITLTVTVTFSVAETADQAILQALVVEHVKAGSNVLSAGGTGEILGQAAEALDLSAASANAHIAVFLK